MIQMLNEESFQTAIAENSVVMVDFWAPWCGPCRMVGPFIEELAEEYEDQAVVGKVNIDEYPSIADQFGITAIPTVLLFKDGELVDRAIGARSKEAFEQMLVSAL